MTTVTLSWAEVRYAAQKAVDREVLNRAQRCRNRYAANHADGNSWALHIRGTIGELVVAKVTGRYWSGLANGDRQQPDVAPGLQVRAAGRLTDALIIHPADADDRPFVLVVGEPPTLTIPGWLLGRDAKQQQWWREGVPNPAYFVPQDALQHDLTPLRLVLGDAIYAPPPVVAADIQWSVGGTT